MRTSLKAVLVTLLAGTALSAPLSAASAEGDRGHDRGSDRGYGRDDDRDDDRGGGRDDLKIVGLVDGTTLVEFTSDRTRIRGSRDVQGLSGDQRLVGIDYRVQDGKLYGVGNAGGVYSIDDRGRATKVKQLTVALAGTNFGVDFNPAANALRVISDTGQNLRQPFADLSAATVSDGPLAYTAGTPATGVTGAAYTNNDADANTATTLYDLDTTMDQIAIQSPANAGSLAATGKLGVDAGPDAGFDIYSVVRDGSAVDQVAFATIRAGDQYGFYEITLFNGRAERVGGFDRNVSDLAIPLNQL